MRKLLTLPAVLVLAVTGCSGSDDSATPDETPDDRLAEAKASFDGAEYIGFTLSTEALPDGVEGLLTAKGTGTHEPAFTGEVDVKAGLTISAPLVAVGGVVYAQLPFSSSYTEIDPADYGAPDPADLMDTDSGISSLFTATTEAEIGDSEREGERVLTTIDGTIPGEAVTALFPSSGSDAFAVSYAVTDDNDIVAIEVTGPFYDGSADVTYALDFDLEADAVEITAPN